MDDNEKQDEEPGQSENSAPNRFVINGVLKIGQVDPEGRIFNIRDLPESPILKLVRRPEPRWDEVIEIPPEALAERSQFGNEITVQTEQVFHFGIPSITWEYVNITQLEWDRFTRAFFREDALPRWHKPRRPISRKKAFDRARREARRRKKMLADLEPMRQRLQALFEQAIIGGDRSSKD